MTNYFEIVFKEAKKAYKKGEVPVGAVIVKNNKIIAKSHNNRQQKHNVFGHAEINCILKASKKTRDWRLNGCDLYVSLEPCEICKNIITESRINNVYFLLERDFQQKNFYKTCITQTNDCKNIKKEYINLIKTFFNKLRK